jgi:hypothetical protein
MKTFWSLCKVNDKWRLACRPGRAATSATGASVAYRHRPQSGVKVSFVELFDQRESARSGRPQPANLALETERLVAFLHHAHTSSVLLKSYAGTAQTVLAVRNAKTLPRSSFSQSAYLVITSRRRSTAVILR